MKIYIPTFNRSKRQLTANALKNAGVGFVLVINQNDHDDYGDLPTLRWPGNGHLRAKRQWILDRARGKFIMTDDDLHFSSRSKDGRSFSVADADIPAMLGQIDDYLDDYPHGGISKRHWAHSKPRKAVFNTNYISLGAYNKDLFKKPHPKFRLEILPDDDFCIQLLTTGHPSFVLTEYAFEEEGDADGGMNTFRTAKAKFEDRMKLCKRFPGIVVRKPEFKGGWRKEYQRTGTHQQFVFNWSKAYRADHN